MEDIVTLERYVTAIEAEMVAGVLNSNGVRAAVTGDSLMSALNIVADFTAAYAVVVFARDEQRAREILAAAPIETEENESED